jgi:hypothetical protein
MDKNTSKTEKGYTLPQLAAMARQNTATGSYASEINSNACVTGNLNSQFKYNQSDDGPWQEMSKGASFKGNKYLEKIAMSFGNMKKSYDSSSTISKIGLGMSAAGLGLSAASYHNNRKNSSINSTASEINRKSLTALNNINKTLSTAVIAPAPVNTPRPDYHIKQV